MILYVAVYLNENILPSSNGGTGVHFIFYIYNKCMLALFIYHDEENMVFNKNSKKELHSSGEVVQRSANNRMIWGIFL